jgi:signal transduction histidine kinase
MLLLSLNYLILANALLLLVLGLWQLRNDGAVVRLFFLTCLGVATWNASNFLIEERLLTEHIVLIGHIQPFGAMLGALGLLYLASTYPTRTIGNWHLPNLVLFIGLTIALFFTELVSTARIEADEIIYDDGPGWVVLTFYLITLSISALFKFMRSYWLLPAYRDRIFWFILGMAIYIPCALLCNVVLPAFGNYDYLIVGRLSASVVPVLMFYAMTKHEFLDASVIINKQTAWFCVLLILVLAVALVQQLAAVSHGIHVAAMTLLVLAAALLAQPLQRFLLTTAKRKFVRGWYSIEVVFHTLSSRITQEKDREALFREVQTVLDEVFELENMLSVVAVRDDQDQFSFYRIPGQFHKIEAVDPLIQALTHVAHCMPLGTAPPEVVRRLRELGFRGSLEQGVLLPFHSPEYLEGALVLGERSNQQGFNEADYRFFDSLISFLSPILYRLTPMEKLEQLYNESRQRLHEAEIQLIRAQKVESIVHATRQCHHEIRTPLNIIRLGIGRIKSLEDLDSYKEIAREEIDHALRVVEETLAITEVSSEAVRRFTPVDVNDIVRRCLRLIDRGRYDVVLDLGDLPLVPALGSDIQVVVINLIHNAMDAMPDGGTLAFTSRQLPDAVEVGVADTGSGIREELRARVWEPYVSGRPTAAGNSTAGRGWGLTIVNRIINQHGGTIRFTSVVNHGTRFVFTLPMAQAAMAVPQEVGVEVTGYPDEVCEPGVSRTH